MAFRRTRSGKTMTEKTTLLTPKREGTDGSQNINKPVETLEKGKVVINPQVDVIPAKSPQLHKPEATKVVGVAQQTENNKVSPKAEVDKLSGAKGNEQIPLSPPKVKNSTARNINVHQMTETAPLLPKPNDQSNASQNDTKQQSREVSQDLIEAITEEETSSDDDVSLMTKTSDDLKRDAQISLLADLYIKCTRQHRMHRLSHEYFHKRDATFNFFPLLLLTMFSAILSFLSTVDMFESTLRELFSIAVSIFAIFSVAVQSYAKYSNFAAKFEMHRSAAIELLKIGDRIQILFSDPDLHVPGGVVPDANKAGSLDSSDNNKVINQDAAEGAAEIGEGNKSVVSNARSKKIDLTDMKNLSIEDKISIHQMLYDHVIESIDSTFPRAVTEAFGIMDARLNISFRTKFTQKQYNRNFKVDSDVVVWLSERLIKIAAYNELYTELANSRGWPWCATEPHKAVDRALARVHRTYVESSRSFLAVDVHMDETIWTLCTWAFCCCFDPTSWFWSSCVEARRKQRKAQKRDYVEV